MRERPLIAPRIRAGFTLVELLIAVVVLLVVILAVGRIFSTAGQVTAYGQATADLLQEARAIENQMRRDFARISKEGFLAIQCIEVRNDVNFASSGQLLDPAKDPDYVFRADRLILFVDGFAATSGYVESQELSGGATVTNNPHSAVSRVYYGHGVQFPTGKALSDPCCYGDGQPLTPWSFSDPFNENTLVEMQAWPGGGFGSPIVGTQPPPAEWLLLRQPVLLADDGGSPLFYGSQGRNGAGSIWPDPYYDGGVQDRGSIRKGRVDIAGQTPEAIERFVTKKESGFPSSVPGNYAPDRPWIVNSGAVPSGQRVIAQAFAYPRGEKTAPSSSREDQMLTNAMLGSNVSSFAIDWTYDDGAGRQSAPDGSTLLGVDLVTDDATAMGGVVVDAARTQPWFGLPDLPSNQNAFANRGVRTFTSYAATDPSNLGNAFPSWPVYPQSIEGAVPVDVVAIGSGSNAQVRTYQAAFGFNRNRPFTSVGSGPEGRWMSPDLAYTPLPSAIRVTLVLHDPRGTITEGRTFQFTIPLDTRE